MIVVAVVGILATIAVFTFGKTSKSAKATSEVAAMFAEFKIRQEQYHLENGAYLSTGSNDADMWPTAPGPAEPTSLQPLPAAWVALRMAPDKSAVYCSYVTIGGRTDPGGGTVTPSPGPTAVSEFDYAPPVGDWYYLLAECDMDGNAAVNSRYFARSDREGIIKVDEGR